MAKAVTLLGATLAEQALEEQEVSSCACRKAVSGQVALQERAELAGIAGKVIKTQITQQ
jgi:hypothetical protein